jgi:CheY-like chemotaxis protein
MPVGPRPAPPGTARAPEVAAARTMARKMAKVKSHSVLVVDDDRGVRDLLADALREAGHDVQMAADGDEALQQLRDGVSPCVVLSDVRMPRMDGFELSREASRDPQLAAIPIVTVTGDRVLSFTSPARDKPYSVAELDAIVQRSCRLHRRAPADDEPN